MKARTRYGEVMAELREAIAENRDSIEIISDSHQTTRTAIYAAAAMLEGSGIELGTEITRDGVLVRITYRTEFEPCPCWIVIGDRVRKAAA
jgi:hypothetical protein